MQLRTLFGGTAVDVQHTRSSEDHYVRWRRETDAVAESYRLWNSAPRGERWLAYAAYLAALDREEGAARAYRRAVGHGGGGR